MNTNFLKGKRCPECGSTTRFVVEAKTVVSVSDGGFADPTDFEIAPDAHTVCPECEHEGPWSTFTDPVSPVIRKFDRFDEKTAKALLAEIWIEAQKAGRGDCSAADFTDEVSRIFYSVDLPFEGNDA